MNKFVVVYLDDIVVYSQTLKEHLSHLCTVFERLRENSFYVKLEKCSFAQHKILFWIGGGTIRMDKEKVRAITEWQAPTKSCNHSFGLPIITALVLFFCT